MNFLKSIVIMLSLYTKIPMPFIEWDGENRKNVLTVLPLAGFVTGAFEILWLLFCAFFKTGALIYAAGACVTAAAVTGGIHIDGLSDTADAKASHASPERKQQILADPHTGAFGALAVVLFEIVCFALYAAIFDRGNAYWFIHLPLVLICIFTASRALIQLGIAFLPSARNEGMLYTFSSVSDKRLLIINAVIVLAVCQGFLIFVFGPESLVFAVFGALLLAYFCRMAVRGFGGISGDLCGWMIEMSVLVFLAAAVVLERLI
ncbi:MAG: adenosylcobinamide-GDP ribazoletransferase [Anaerovoracaceae bacterium]|jgi:adenosylcobinamide-GDP ribazoletransferase